MKSVTIIFLLATILLVNSAPTTNTKHDLGKNENQHLRKVRQLGGAFGGEGFERSEGGFRDNQRDYGNIQAQGALPFGGYGSVDAGFSNSDKQFGNYQQGAGGFGGLRAVGF